MKVPAAVGRCSRAHDPCPGDRLFAAQAAPKCSHRDTARTRLSSAPHSPAGARVRSQVERRFDSCPREGLKAVGGRPLPAATPRHGEAGAHASSPRILAGAPLGGCRVDARGQGDARRDLRPSFESDRTIYCSFSEPAREGATRRVSRVRGAVGLRRTSEVKVISARVPTSDGDKPRLAPPFGPDACSRDAGERRIADAPLLRARPPLVKVLRINRTDRPRKETFAGHQCAARDLDARHRNVSPPRSLHGERLLSSSTAPRW